MSVEIESVTRLIEEAAAEEVLPRFRRLAAHEVSEKESGELVTSADLAVEARLGRALSGLLAGSRVVGEEAAAEQPRIVDLLREPEPVWLIDPVDGTSNFAAGKPAFAVMVALVRAGELAAGWIHEPCRPRTAVAEAGGGAWIGGRRLRVAAGAPLGAMRGTLHGGRHGGPELARRIQAFRQRWGVLLALRCAGGEYLRLATGESHFTLFTRMMPWDHAPGVLIHGEAGGWARTLDGEVYSPARRDTPGLLMAPDAASWRALHEVLLA